MPPSKFAGIGDCFSALEVRTLFSRRFDAEGQRKPINECTLRRWRKRRMIAFIRINSRVYLYPKAEILRILSLITESALDVISLNGVRQLKSSSEVLHQMHRAGKSPRILLEAHERKREIERRAAELREELQTLQRELSQG